MDSVSTPENRKKAKSKKLTLLQTILLVLVLPLTGTAALIEYLSWNNEQKAVEQLVEQLQQGVGDRIQQRIEYLTEAPPKATARTARAIRRGDLDTQNLQGWQNYLIDQGSFLEDLTFLYFANPSGDYTELHNQSDTVEQVALRSGARPELITRTEVVAGQTTVITQTTEPYDPRARPWYKTAIESQQPQWTEPYEVLLTGSSPDRYGQLPTTTAFSFVRPFYDDNSGVLLGVIGADFTLADITRFLQSLNISKTGEAFILNRQGDLVATSHVEENGATHDENHNESHEATDDHDSVHLVESREFLKEQFGDLAKIDQTQTLTFGEGRDRLAIQISPFSDDHGLDWLIAVVIPESDFTDTIRDRSEVTLLLTLGILSGVFLLATVIAHRISYSVLRLSKASEAISAGNLQQQVIGSGIRELDTTAQAFNHMAQQLQHSYTQLENHSKHLEVKVRERTQALETEVRERRQSEDAFKTLVANVPGTVYRCRNTPDWNIDFISDSAEELCGYPASDFVNDKVRTFGDIMYPGDSELVAKVVEAALQKRQPYAIEYRIIHADGSIRWVYDRGRGVFAEQGDEQGEALYLDGVFIDVTAQKKAEAATAQSEARYHSLFDDAPISIWEEDFSAVKTYLQALNVLDTVEDFDQYFSRHPEVVLDCIQRVKVLDVNQAALTLFEAEQKEDLLTRLTTHKNSAGRDGFARMLVARCEGKLSFEAELINYTLTGKKKNIIFKSFTAPGYEESWERVLISIIDISQRKKAEAELLKAKKAAEVANKAKSTFLANMSHELRSPLNAVLGFAQVMNRSDSLPPEHQDDVQIISRSGEHLLSLINDVLDMSKIEAGRTVLTPADFDLLALVRDLRDMFRLRAEEKQLQLRVETADDLPQYVRADQGKLKQVLINLLNNAIKFTDAGGITLRVGVKQNSTEQTSAEQDSTEDSSIENISTEDSSTEDSSTEDSSTEDGSTEDDSRLAFSVVDTGVGIQPGEIQALFEPFVQSRSGLDSQEGTGLGLSISRKFVELMGGTMTLRSPVNEQGQGTAVDFDIQAEVGNAASITGVIVGRKVIQLASNQPRCKILVVDDKAANRQLLSRLLSPVGFELQSANDGQTAVEKAMAWQPDLIFMDLRMPVIDGIKTTQKIRTLTQARAKQDTSFNNLKIIALSATSFQSEQVAALDAGCDDFVRKPFQADEIFDTIAQHLDIKYHYADENTPSDTSSSEPPISLSELSEDSLAGLSPELLAQLESATLKLQWCQLLEVIESIREHNDELADVLRQTVEDFHYRQILKGIQAVKSSRSIHARSN